MYNKTNEVNAVGTVEDDVYLSMKDVADILKVSIHTPRKWLARRQMPAPDIRSHRFIRWRKSTLQEFLAEPVAWRKNYARQE